MGITLDSVRIAHFSKEILSLRVNLQQLEESSAGDAVAEPMRERIVHLTHSIIEATAENGTDLASKAGLLLYWIDPVSDDIPHLLSASLCRDVMLMFPGDG